MRIADFKPAPAGNPKSAIRNPQLKRLYNSLMSTAISTELDAREQLLLEGLKNLGSAIVAFSGGTDSAYLAWAANRALGERALAITADSASIPRSHLEDALDFARRFGIRHEVIATREFENPLYLENSTDRCYHCKDELFTRLDEMAVERGFAAICYGVNKDDTGDFRPGHSAARKHRVVSPLLDAGLGKNDIRELSRRAGLPTWDRPASACLSSRIPYGTAVTPENLRQVEAGEEALRRLGFRQCRVRHHGEMARIEIAQDELPRALTVEMAAEFTRIFKALGFRFVTLDLEGYRQGSFNIL